MSFFLGDEFYDRSLGVLYKKKFKTKELPHSMNVFLRRSFVFIWDFKFYTIVFTCWIICPIFYFDSFRVVFCFITIQPLSSIFLISWTGPTGYKLITLKIFLTCSLCFPLISSFIGTWLLTLKDVTFPVSTIDVSLCSSRNSPLSKPETRLLHHPCPEENRRKFVRDFL